MSNLGRPPKIYISGPMTGRTINDVWVAFAMAEAEINNMYPNAVIVNPCNMNPIGTPYDDCMKACLKAIEDCDSIFMIRGWYNSRGAVMERNHAVKLHLDIIHQKEVPHE